MAGSDGAATGADTPDAAPASPWLRALSGRTANVVAGVAFVVLVVMTFAFVHHYALDVIYDDQWKDVDLLRHAHTGTLTLGDLWAQHNENRVLVPNLVVLLLGWSTHLQVQVEDYASGTALCGAALLMILTHRRRSPWTPWIAYVPVALVLVSAPVLADTLFGFNLSWFLVVLFLAGTLYAADRPELSVPWLVGAVALAALGSLSSFQGLFIWPSVLILFLLRRRAPVAIVVWVASAAGIVVLYFVHFDASASGSSVSALGSESIVRYFVSEFGNVLGSSQTNALPLGVVVLVVACGALGAGVAGSRSDGGLIGVTLVAFGLLFVGSVAIGRTQLGLLDAARYAPFVLTVWVGAYLVFLDAVLRPERTPAGGFVATPERHTPRRVSAVLFAVALLLLVVQALLGRQAVKDAAGWYGQERSIANVEGNIDRATDAMLTGVVGGYPPSYMRSLALFARSDGLSLYGTGQAAQEARRGLDPSLFTQVVRPASGERVLGRLILDATTGTSDPLHLVFRLSERGVAPRTIAVAQLTIYGWTARWDSRTVPDGTYQLTSQVTSASGPVHTSPAVRIVVVNGR